MTKDYIKSPKGHKWQKEGRSVDFFAMDAGFHNGPRCVNCGYSFCEHCTGDIRPCTNPKPRFKLKKRKAGR